MADWTAVRHPPPANHPHPPLITCNQSPLQRHLSPSSHKPGFLSRRFLCLYCGNAVRLFLGFLFFLLFMICSGEKLVCLSASDIVFLFLASDSFIPLCFCHALETRLFSVSRLSVRRLLSALCPADLPVISLRFLFFIFACLLLFCAINSCHSIQSPGFCTSDFPETFRIQP